QPRASPQTPPKSSAKHSSSEYGDMDLDSEELTKIEVDVTRNIPSNSHQQTAPTPPEIILTHSIDLDISKVPEVNEEDFGEDDFNAEDFNAFDSGDRFAADLEQ